MGYEVEVTTKNIDAWFRKFMMLGFTLPEQGNLVGAMIGLQAQPKGWTKKEIKYILFLRELDNTIDH